ncbi:unnamed protein product [Bursaphelenchus xylophilus]|uniref:(pine wood nematode) hypothetical protein n=1 Tax=Bursaphelenchus xylophilus TaxID=6326 RepID=A0A7I8X4X1_BURXY|nr:unnamed protein product [Bursaphelenchus xylophilus]CAG9129148.1 unnamed protein product [Bursaphelenchus xylophilus]
MWCLLFIALLATVQAEEDGDIFAVLIAGIDEMWAEASEENIIVFLLDKGKNYSGNPWPGELHTYPDSPDYRVGCKIDYTGNDTNLAAFLDVLRQNQTSPRPVLRSTSKDNVLIFHASHGWWGGYQMPGGGMDVAHLQKTLTYMHEQGFYKELVFVLDSCNSGSLFFEWLTPKYNILALTAAPHDHVAYIKGFYVPKIHKSIGLVGSLSYWWQDTLDHKDISNTTMRKMYWDIYHRNNFVRYYGDLDILSRTVDQFHGRENPHPTLRGSRKKASPSHSIKMCDA